VPATSKNRPGPIFIGKHPVKIVHFDHIHLMHNMMRIAVKNSSSSVDFTFYLSDIVPVQIIY